MMMMMMVKIKAPNLKVVVLNKGGCWGGGRHMIKSWELLQCDQIWLFAAKYVHKMPFFTDFYATRSCLAREYARAQQLTLGRRAGFTSAAIWSP